jgi:Domain of unknown function (DUF4395)
LSEHRVDPASGGVARKSVDGRGQRLHYFDPRGPRFGAVVTSVVLAVVLVTGWGWLLAAQAVVFAIGAVDLRLAPYGVLFRRFVRPRLGAPVELESAAPPQFAQAVGFLFAAVGMGGYLAGAQPVGIAATALAFVAAFLNAAFGLCLGCEMHLLIARALHRPRQPRFVSAQSK